MANTIAAAMVAVCQWLLVSVKWYHNSLSMQVLYILIVYISISVGFVVFVVL